MAKNNNITSLEQAMFLRIKKHKNASSILQLIEKAQILIEDSARYLADDRKHLSYYKAVAEKNMKLIEKYTAIRNFLINRYNRLTWEIYREDLPIFSSTGMVQMKVTVYSAISA